MVAVLRKWHLGGLCTARATSSQTRVRFLLDRPLRTLHASCMYVDTPRMPGQQNRNAIYAKNHPSATIHEQPLPRRSRHTNDKKTAAQIADSSASALHDPYGYIHRLSTISNTARPIHQALTSPIKPMVMGQRLRVPADVSDSRSPPPKTKSADHGEMRPLHNHFIRSNKHARQPYTRLSHLVAGGAKRVGLEENGLRLIASERG